LFLCKLSKPSLQAVIIKRYTNIVKVYSSVVASLFAAGTSSFVLHDPPAPIFYCGCILAMTAVLQLQRARAAKQQAADVSTKVPADLTPRVRLVT
jgi:hypothetical protein